MRNLDLRFQMQTFRMLTSQEPTLGPPTSQELTFHRQTFQMLTSQELTFHILNLRNPTKSRVRISLLTLTSKNFLATCAYFQIETFIIALLKARGPLGPLIV